MDKEEEYYSTITKNEIMLLAMMRTDLETILLNEISQRRTNIIWSHLYVKSKTAKLIETESGMMITRGRGWEELKRC